MTKREMKQRIRELEGHLDGLEKWVSRESSSLTRLYARVERLERKARGPTAKIPLAPTDSATWGTRGRDWDWVGGLPQPITTDDTSSHTLFLGTERDTTDETEMC